MVNQKMLHHELPNMAVIILGIVVCALCTWYWGLIYAVIVMISFFWMGRFICPHCIGFGLGKCPSLYGMVAVKLFNKAEQPAFEKAFKRNLPVVVSEWVVPVFIAIPYMIFVRFDWFLLVMLILFIIIAFVWLPMKSQKDCAECSNTECPQKQSAIKKYKLSPI